MPLCGMHIVVSQSCCRALRAPRVARALRVQIWPHKCLWQTCCACKQPGLKSPQSADVTTRALVQPELPSERPFNPDKLRSQQRLPAGRSRLLMLAYRCSAGFDCTWVSTLSSQQQLLAAHTW